MNRPIEPVFTTRETVTLQLPLGKHTRILHPEQVILKIDDEYHDVGALCYALRSDKQRKPSQPREVVTSSLIKQRPKQVLQLIKVLSNLALGGGKSLATAGAYAVQLKRFIDWADSKGLNDCLAGDDATRNAFRAWATDTRERYQRQQFNERQHNSRLTYVCDLLEATTNLNDLMQGIRKLKRRTNPNGGTEPLEVHDFAHAYALNQCLFDGLCDLVLECKPFPYKLDLPASLSWTENHLWLFPTNMWRLPPHLHDDTSRTKLGRSASWPYDYKRGRMATADEIWHRYAGHNKAAQQKAAKLCIKAARLRLEEANTDAHDIWRITLGMHAQRAFLFLFFCNTGGNVQPVRSLETNGTIDVSVQNQNFRALKWRAGGKEITLRSPVAFMPRLRRFMELRHYLLQGRKTPYLFFSLGTRGNQNPTRIGAHELRLHYTRVLTEIDPQLPKMSPRALRASVDDYYLRLHDSMVAAAVMGHTVETEQRNYARGSAIDHHDEMTIFMTSVANSARRQRVIGLKEVTPETPYLEQGGHCDSFGHPDALADDAPVQPNCKDSQGCLFCNHRVLIAGEDDARKVASAAYVMEQLILGPKHEEALRPSIAKCDEDLEKIAAFPNCRAMVEKVRKDVFQNENLTPFWADKYHLFLELGIIS